MKWEANRVDPATIPDGDLEDWCREWDFWPADRLREALAHDPYELFCARRTGEESPWHGTLLLHLAGDICDVIYVFVPARMRRRGIAQVMWRCAEEWLREKGTVDRILLEVRQSNAAAQGFYRSLGLSRRGLRQGYYRDGEDAEIWSQDPVPAARS